MHEPVSCVDQGDLAGFLDGVQSRNPNQPEFLQAVREVSENVVPFVADNPEYQDEMLLERMTEPDRIITFRVAWRDDDGQVHVNRAWRVQFSNAIGPYKGGLRFHPSVNESILKFLGFEQCFKNALTGLPMGGAKGGSNFDPKGKSDAEIMRFCQAMMAELHRYIGEHTDIPAGDIGVGTREIGYLFGQYKRIQNRFVGTLTGKAPSFGGSLMRTEATGYGVLYFVEKMLEANDDSIDGKAVVISGSGNVARYAAEKAMEMGADVLTLSDSDGFVHIENGLNGEQLAYVHELKEDEHGRISEFAREFGLDYHEDEAPWGIECDIALPCATQNELDAGAAGLLIDNGCELVAEGANMPCTADAVTTFQDAGITFGPGKAANAGGVAVSGLERAQNAQHLSWTAEEVDEELANIMADIHDKCRDAAGDSGNGAIDYVCGANLAGFRKLADALKAQGVV